MVDDFDVIVIGGGPAGATLSWALAERDYRVLVIDKQNFPRDKTCAGWVTPAVMETLDIDLAHYARENVLQAIHRFRVGMMGQEAVTNDHGDRPVSYGIRRCEFDDYLLERSKAEKALGVKLQTLERDNDSWLINERYRAPLVVGAGGHFCPVAMKMGDGPGKHETAIAAKEVEFEMSAEQSQSCDFRGDTPELWFCRDLKGYAWVFRKGDFLNVGLGREGNKSLKEHLNRFVEQLQSEGRLPPDLPQRFKGHAYLLYDHAMRPLYDDGLLLIGDAAGLAYTQSGEGIRPAIESALIAAEVIEQAQDYSAKSLSYYEKQIGDRFGTRRAGKKPGIELPEWAKLKIAPPLMRSHWFTRHVVTERWFLHEQIPPMRTTLSV